MISGCGDLLFGGFSASMGAQTAAFFGVTTQRLQPFDTIAVMKRRDGFDAPSENGAARKSIFIRRKRARSASFLDCIGDSAAARHLKVAHDGLVLNDANDGNVDPFTHVYFCFITAKERFDTGIMNNCFNPCRLMSIVDNRKAFHDYFIEERFEAGLVLNGWEVKAARGGRAQLKEAYVVIRNGELWLLGAHITPLTSASTHVHAEPTRTRKLLMHAKEIQRLIGQVERAGYTLIPIDLHFKSGRIKLEIGLAKGKKQHDKRQSEKEREWNREKQRLLRDRPGKTR